MAPEPLEVSDYELLFKATDLSKLADIDLSQHLEAYIRNIRNLYNDSSAVKEMNFAEAAMVIQNSSIIFAKNVDSIWARAMNIRLALSANMNRKKRSDDDDDDDDGGGGDEGTAGDGVDRPEKAGKKKKKKVFNVEEFKMLDFMYSDKNIDMKLDFNKLPKKLDKLVLPTSLRVKSKVNKSTDIYTPENEPVGKMNEFRLFWPITKSDYLQEDYTPDDRCVFSERIHEQSFAEPHENPVNGEIFNNDINNTILDGHGPFSPPPPTPPPTPPPMDLPMNDSPESLKDNVDENERECGQRPNKNLDRENIVSLDRIVEKAWEPIPLDKGIPNKPLLKRRVYKLDTSDMQNQRKRKNRGKLDAETESLILTEMFTVGKFHLTKGPGFDQWVLEEFHNEQAKRQKELLLRRKKILDMLDAGSEYEGDFYGFDETEINDGGDFDFDDGDHGDVCDVNNINVPLPANTNNAGTIFDGIGPNSIWNGNADEPLDSGDQYEAHALRTIQQYNANKSLDESRANDLALRVAAWHETIAPVLKEAENRSHFDIHEYGSRILSLFPNNNSRTTIQFEKVAGGEPPEEVARYFLSSLVLANTYNVELSKSIKEDLVTNCLELTLLSKVRHHDEIDDNMRSNNRRS